MLTAAAVEQRLRSMAEPERAQVLQRFFRTGPGEYGEGDRFLGIRVPALRKLSRGLRPLPLDELATLLRSPFHEARLLALLVMVEQYRRGDDGERSAIHELYLRSTAWINNWDLVDTSAEHIIGAHLWERDRAPLRTLARSDLLWDRRIAVLATFHFIKRNDFTDTLDLARLLLADRADLIHKAVGWMLREVGSRDRAALDRFLAAHYHDMPRTMLRYAIEKHEPAQRLRYLKGEV